MYELSKPKSRGYWIILGVIVFAFLSAVLRLSLDEQPLTKEEEMISVANEVNRRAPLLLDSMTRFDGVIPKSGNILQYRFTLLLSSRSDFDSIEFSRQVKEGFAEQIRNNPKKAIFQENELILQAVYSDSSGRYIGSAEVLPTEY